MAAYLVGAIDINDHERYEIYRQKSMPMLMSRNDVQVLTADDTPEIFEGAQPGAHLFIIKFQSMKALREFYLSDDYTAIKHHRLGASHTAFIMGMRGVDEPAG